MTTKQEVKSKAPATSAGVMVSLIPDGLLTRPPFTDQEVKNAIKTATTSEPILIELQRDLPEIEAAIRAITITSDADQIVADKQKSDIRRRKASVKSQKDLMGGPIADLKKANDQTWNPYIAALTNMEDALNQKMVEWQDKKEASANSQAMAINTVVEKTHEKQVKSAERRGLPAPAAPVAAVASVPKTVGSTTFAKIWDFDVQHEDQLPREYLTADRVAIRKAVVQGGVREIPGVRIFDRNSARSVKS